MKLDVLFKHHLGTFLFNSEYTPTDYGMRRRANYTRRTTNAAVNVTVPLTVTGSNFFAVIRNATGAIRTILFETFYVYFVYDFMMMRMIMIMLLCFSHFYFIFQFLFFFCFLKVSD